MRVLLLIDSLDTGGAETMVVPFAQHVDRARVDLRVLGLFNVAVRAVPTEQNIEALRTLGVPFADVGTRNLRDTRAFGRLAQEIRANKIELIHAHLTFSIIWGACAARRTRVPLIVTLHGLSDPPVGSRAWGWEWLARLALRQAARVVCVSNAVRDFYRRAARLNAARAVTIYNGIDLAPFDQQRGSRAATRRTWGIADDVPVIAMVALLRPGKGHDELLAAIPAVRREFPRARFLIIGGGVREAELRRAALPHGDAAQFLGHRADVPALLAASDLFVLPSYGEALPTVILEAMAARLPVVATRVGGIPEIVREGETGQLIPPHDADALAQAILDLLRNGATAGALGNAGRARVEAIFNSQHYARALADLYAQVQSEQVSRK